MKNQNTNTQLLLKAIFSSKDSYRDFHDLYWYIRDAIVGDYIETLQLDELLDELYWIARGELFDMHKPDDEYGTDWHLGKNMDYEDCAVGLLRALSNLGFEVVPIFYDGELNSVMLKQVKPIWCIRHEAFACSEDDDLPF